MFRFKCIYFTMYPEHFCFISNHDLLQFNFYQPDMHRGEYRAVRTAYLLEIGRRVACEISLNVPECIKVTIFSQLRYYSDCPLRYKDI